MQRQIVWHGLTATVTNRTRLTLLKYYTIIKTGFVLHRFSDKTKQKELRFLDYVTNVINFVL